MPLISTLEKVNIEGLFEVIEPLLKELNGIDLSGIVDALKPLLSALKKIDIKGIIDQLMPLSNPEGIKMVIRLLSNAGSLLSTKFVGQTSELIGDATPVSYL